MKGIVVFVKLSIVIFTLSFYSCTGLGIKKSDLLTIDTKFSGDFKDASFMFSKRSAIPFPVIDTSMEEQRTMSSLLFLNGALTSGAATISLNINAEENLQVTYRDSLHVMRTEIYEGKLKKSGFYEIFLFKERIEIPPVIPIIYSKVNIGRLRIGMTKERSLIVDTYFTHGGNIFIFAAGSSSRKQYYFRSIE